MRTARGRMWALGLWAYGHAFAPAIQADLIPEDVSSGTQVLQGYSASYALIIEMSDYPPGPWPDLDSIPAELNAVEHLLREQGVSSITRLRNLDVTQLRTGFEAFIHGFGAEKDARLIVFYAGHGYTTADGTAYLVPAMQSDPQIDMGSFSRDALSMDQVVSWARQFESKHVLFFFDSCFSGSIFLQRGPVETRRWISKLTQAPVRYFITAGSAHETVPARSELVPELIRGVRFGKADLNRDGYVTSGELGLFLRESIMKRSIQTPQHGPLRDGKYDGGDVVFKVIEPKDDSAKISTFAQSSTPEFTSPLRRGIQRNGPRGSFSAGVFDIQYRVDSPPSPRASSHAR